MIVYVMKMLLTVCYYIKTVDYPNELRLEFKPDLHCVGVFQSLALAMANDCWRNSDVRRTIRSCCCCCVAAAADEVT